MNTNEDEIAANKAWWTLQSLCHHASPKSFIDGLKINIQWSVENAIYSHSKNQMSKKEVEEIGKMAADRLLFTILGVHCSSAFDDFKYK